jgi:hypothetical protein
MKLSHMGVQRAMQSSGVLILVGLLTEIVTLVWEKPLAFLVFAGIGGGLVIAGILVYLYSLVAGGSGTSASTHPSRD